MQSETLSTRGFSRRVLCLARIFRPRKEGNLKILVTGSTDGIGLATAHQLLDLGHEILVHGRSREKAEFAARKILLSSKKPHAPQDIATPVWGDLSKMNEVVALAKQVTSAASDLDVLINNAGVYMNERVLTEDGFEMTFAVNHLAVHLLTHHLLPVLKTRPAARIVTVSSIAHQRSHLKLDDLAGNHRFDGYEAYANSKLCNILFTRASAALLKGTHVTVNCLHPGVIETKLLHAGFNIKGDRVENGSATSVFLATHPSVSQKTGGYFINSQETYPSRIAQDDNLAVQLWRKSEELLKPWY